MVAVMIAGFSVDVMAATMGRAMPARVMPAMTTRVMPSAIVRTTRMAASVPAVAMSKGQARKRHHGRDQSAYKKAADWIFHWRVYSL